VLHDKDHPWGFAPPSDRAAWEQRAEFLRHQVLVAQGLWPMPEKTPLNAVIHGRIDRDGYTIEKVYFASMPGHYVTGNLYRPKNRPGKLPAVLCPYGHWPDGRFIWKTDEQIKKEIDTGAETNPHAARSPLQANCAMLARMGCIVFHYDMVGYCDSTKIPHREGFTDAQAVLRLQSFMGLQTWNSIRSLDFVLSLPDVDPSRIAVTGSSSGGTQTIALCAADSRPTVSFPMVMVSMNMQGGCVCENAPLYRVMTNNVELASLFAPKPEGCAAANDWTHDFMTRGLPEMKQVWRLFGAEDQVEGAHVNFGHNHNLHSRELQYAFLNKHLKLEWSEPVKEAPFVPVPPAQLSVFDVEHPRPADELDANELRKQMTRASDEQLAKLREKPDELREVLRVALAAMVVDDSRTVPIAKPQAAGHGEVIVCTDPATADLLRNSGAMVVEIPPARRVAAPATKPSDVGFTLGYERSALAERVCEIAAQLRGAPGKSVQLIATGEDGPAALLACALTGSIVTRAAIDLKQFDFDQVHDADDPMMLPGGLKYGGIYAFLPLCTGQAILLTNARRCGSFDVAAKVAGVTIEEHTRRPAEMIHWLLG
jgi:hypothetical protein